MLVVVTVVILASCCAACFADAPQPIVAVDEFHLNVLRPNLAWRMTMLTSELTAGGYAVREVKEPLSAAALAGCSVLLITTPSSDYTTDELTAIRSFLDAGGGVMICANYGISNGLVPPWAPICQILAGNVGLSLDNNSPTDSLHNIYAYPYWITIGRSAIGTHPVTTGINSLQSFAMTTMPAPSGTTALASTDSDASPASRPAIIAVPYDAGRVILSGSALYLADPIYGLNINGQTMDMMGLLAADNRRFAYNAITWLAGAAGRPLVSATSSATSGIAYDTVTISGMVCDASLGQYVLEYAPADDQTTWTQIGPVHTSSVISSILGTWDVSGVSEGDYMLRIRAADSQGNQYSVIEPVEVRRLIEIGSIADLNKQAEGALVKLTGKEVVAGSDELVGRLCIEESNRLSGVTVLTSDTVHRGSDVTVIGLVKRLDGVLAIDAISTTAQPGPERPIGPLGMTNRNCSTVLARMGIGGVVTKVWGDVLSTDADGFVIGDGSGATLKIVSKYAQSSIVVSDGVKHVVVSGVVSSCNGVPCLIVRNQNDVQSM